MFEFATSLVVTMALAPAFRAAMLRHGVIDVPNHRSSHIRPTPRGGGWACATGIFVATLAALAGDASVPIIALAAAFVLALIGFADDRRGLPALARLAAQIALGIGVGTATGGLVGAVVGALLYPLAVNVVNFMDGINGITSLTMGVWGATAFLVGVEHHLPDVSLIGAVTAGAALGFLPWNAPLARLFLGDVGSYLFGALVAGGILLGWQGRAPVPVLLAPLFLYITDTMVTLAQRALRREPILSAHRDHVYQRLVRVVGLSHTTAAVIVAGSSALLTGAWLWAGPAVATSLSIASGCLYVGCVRLVGTNGKNLTKT